MRAFFLRSRAVSFLAATAITALSAAAQPPKAPESITLQGAFKGAFLIGAAIRPDQVDGHNPSAGTLIAREFDSITAENVMKMGPIHPRPGNDAASYDFAPADAFVEFGQKQKMKIIGHNLCWHSQ